MKLYPRNDELRSSGWSKIPSGYESTERTIAELLPDLPGIVHGVKSVDPYVLQCDGCLAVFEQRDDEPLVTFLHTVRFHHPERGQFNRRMCDPCWAAEGIKEMGTGKVS